MAAPPTSPTPPTAEETQPQAVPMAPTPVQLQQMRAFMGRGDVPQQAKQAAMAAFQKQFPTAQSALPPLPVRFGSALARAISERTTEPAMALVSPRSGVLERVAAGATLAGTIGAPYLSGGGALAQAVAETAGTKPDTARLIGGAAEIAGGIGRLGYEAARAVFAGKSLVKKGTKALAELPGEADLLPSERLTHGLRNEAVKVFGSRKKVYSKLFDSIEQRAVRDVKAIQPGSAGYSDLKLIDNFLDDAELQLTKRERGFAERILEATRNDKPVSMQDVVKLRKTLGERTLRVDAADPATAASARKAAGLRRLTTDAFEKGLPDDMRADFLKAAQGYRTQFIEPRRMVRRVLARNTTPHQAFTSIYNTEDPMVFRTMARLSEKSPGMRQKLAWGFLEDIAVQSADFASISKVHQHVERWRPMLVATNVFKPQELSDLASMLKSRQIASLNRTFADALSTGPGLTRLGFAAFGLNMLKQDPKALVIAAVATGGMSSLRRLMTLPEGPAKRQFALAVVKNTAQQIENVFGENTREEVAENPDDLAGS